jgi:hypothetical protein
VRRVVATCFKSWVLITLAQFVDAAFDYDYCHARAMFVTV